MSNINETIKLREKGQITIPEKIRNLLPWLYPRAVLQLTPKREKIIISPLLPQVRTKKKKLSVAEWKEIFLTFKKIRKSGRQINALKSIMEDRKNH